MANTISEALAEAKTTGTVTYGSWRFKTAEQYLADLKGEENDTLLFLTDY